MNLNLSIHGPALQDVATSVLSTQPTFVLAKCRPDTFRNEPRNVGVVLQMPSGVVLARFVGETDRGSLTGPLPAWLRPTSYIEWHSFWRRALREGIRCGGRVVAPTSGGFLPALCSQSKDSYPVGDGGTVLDSVREEDASKLLGYLFATLVSTPDSVDSVRYAESLPAADAAELVRRQRWLAREIRTHRVGRGQLGLGKMRRVEGGNLADGSGALADPEERHYQIGMNGVGALGWRVEHVVTGGAVLLPEADVVTLIPFAPSLLAAHAMANHAYTLDAIDSIRLAVAEGEAEAWEMDKPVALPSHCPHGQADPSVCDACLLDGDLAADAARERRASS